MGRPIDVIKMTENEAIELLVRTSGKESIGDVDSTTSHMIISHLGYLALAIDQAGAYIRAHNLTLNLFLDHFNNRREIILNHIPTLSEYTKKLSDEETAKALSVFTTWEMSFQQIRREGDYKKHKEHLLTISAFLDNAHIHQYFSRPMSAERARDG